MNADSRPTNTRTHELKVWPEFFTALMDGSKTFEVRKDDRGFRVGDRLYLNEWSPNGDGTGEYTSGQLLKVVTYILAGPAFGVARDYVVMGLADPEPDAFCASFSDEPVAVSGWVIEGAWSPIDTPDYWVGSSAWSPDPYKALRFATSKDAQQAADMMCSGLSVRLCEHEWAEQPETKVAVRGRWESTGLCGCTGELTNGERPFACEHGFKTELQQPQNGGAGK